ncbi:MAG: T9SS type A sorting domain-containing protein [Bacteroidetes bacterium]|nr:T9SS type A sorting domain-containing protein [Bacteroidota bacterium]
MKILLSVIFSFLIVMGELFANTYYVSNTGNDANPGTLAQPWKTVTYASTKSNPGDTIYIKAGLYNESIVISKSGTQDKPVLFIGYKSTPGDAPPVLVNRPDPYAAFSSSDMPTFDGGNRTANNGLNCRNQKFLKIKNLQIQNYRYGLIAGGASQDAGNNHYFNINIKSIGDVSASYNGMGIWLGSMGTLFSNNNFVDSCLVVNAAAEGIGIYGNYNSVTGCKVYCNENTGGAATDYYIIVTGSYNVFTGCYIEMEPTLSHYGHGYSCKTNAEQIKGQGLNVPPISSEYNVFKYCVAKNMGESFCVRHRTARYNLFYHCKAIGSHTGLPGSEAGRGNGVAIRDGASNNVFDGCVAENCNAAIRFNDTVEDEDNKTNPTGNPGNNNLIINNIAINCYAGVYFFDYSIPSDAGNNTIANSTFYKIRYMFNAERSCKNMKYVNNIFYGTLDAPSGGAFKKGTYSSDIVPNGATTNFSNCTFYNIEGGMPSGFASSAINCISADPLFKNAAGNDFHLLSGSPGINSGKTLEYVKTDFDSITRPQGTAYDMGAYEFQTVTSLPNIPSGEGFISIHPNPSSGTLHISTKEPGCEFSVHDMAGKLIRNHTSASTKVEMKLDNLSVGMYILRAQNRRRQDAVKFLVLK